MSKKPSPAAARRSFLALTCLAPALVPALAHADTAPSDNGQVLGGVTVSDTAIDTQPGLSLIHI